MKIVSLLLSVIFSLSSIKAVGNHDDCIKYIRTLKKEVAELTKIVMQPDAEVDSLYNINLDKLKTKTSDLLSIIKELETPNSGSKMDHNGFDRRIKAQ